MPLPSASAIAGGGNGGGNAWLRGAGDGNIVVEKAISISTDMLSPNRLAASRGVNGRYHHHRRGRPQCAGDSVLAPGGPSSARNGRPTFDTQDELSTTGAYRPTIDQTVVIANGATVWLSGKVVGVSDSELVSVKDTASG